MSAKMMTDKTIGEKTIGDLLLELRDIANEREEIATRDKELGAQRETVERELLRRAEREGVPGFKSPAGSISFGEDIRAKYEPEKWDDIVKWAAATGNQHIVQRRMTDARVLALVLEGVVLPDGLTLEPYTKVSFRRK